MVLGVDTSRGMEVRAGIERVNGFDRKVVIAELGRTIRSEEVLASFVTWFLADVTSPAVEVQGQRPIIEHLPPIGLVTRGCAAKGSPVTSRC